MADSGTFANFLRRLSTVPSARSAYQDDPVGVMKSEGLSDSQVVAVLSQDPARIQAELGDQSEDALFRIRVMICIIVDL
jgi:hypothetical protein